MKGKISRQLLIRDKNNRVTVIDLNNLFDGGEDTLKKRYMRKILKDIWASYMSERQAEMAVMFYADNKSMKDIAAELRVDRSVVTRTMQRAKTEISDNLGHYRAEFMRIALSEGELEY